MVMRQARRELQFYIFSADVLVGSRVQVQAELSSLIVLCGCPRHTLTEVFHIFYLLAKL